jgi:hypothetical protein
MKTTANYATHPAPKRLEALRISVESIIDQVDLVRIYWNNYNVHDVPDWFRFHEKIDSSFGPDLTDNGKFAELPWLEEDEYFFTCDDKIIYPNDYVEVMSRYLEECNFVTCHGRKINPEGNYQNSYYLGGHFVYDYRLTVGIFRHGHIEIPGSGVSAFDTENFNPKRIVRDKRHKMTDLLLGLYAVENGDLPYLVPHAEGWLRSQQMPTSICQEQQQTDQTQQIEIVKEIINILGL